MKIEKPTAEEIEVLNENRLSPENAQELANLILTKLDKYDFKKLETEDYEEAMREIENLKRWASGKEHSRDKIESLVDFFNEHKILSSIMAAGFIGMATAEVTGGGFAQSAASLCASFGAAFVLAHGEGLNGNFKTKEKISELELKNLENKTEKRLEGEQS